jgi:hypothetical protein
MKETIPNKVMFINGSETGLSNRFKAQVIERRPGHPDEGKVVSETDFAPNLILENGMNKIATTAICNLFLYCAVGSGSTPTQDSSGAITATATGTAVTSGTAIFAAGDVGKLLRFATGEKSIITAYTDSTHVTVATAMEVAAATLFTMYRIAQTGLDTEVARTGTYLTGAGNCGSTLAGAVNTHQRTFDFPIEASDQTYNEVGFSDLSAAGANLNMRGIFAGAPVSVLTGQQLRVIYFVLVTVSPISPRDREVTISGWPSLAYPVVFDDGTDAITLVAHGFAADTKVKFDGTAAPGGTAFDTYYYVVPDTADTFKIAATPGGAAIDITSAGTDVNLYTNTVGQEQLAANAVSIVRSDTGNTDYSEQGINEPSRVKSMQFVTDDTFPVFPVTTSDSFVGPTGSNKTLAADAYTSGSYVLTWRATYAAGDCNSSLLRKIYIAYNDLGTWWRQWGLVYLFDHPQEKTNLHTLTIIWKFSWDRDFV